MKTFPVSVLSLDISLGLILLLCFRSWT